MINRHQIETIANGLAQLGRKFVFVGAAVGDCYIDDPAFSDFRPTQDVDVILQIIHFPEYVAFQEELIKGGFAPLVEDGIICRYRYQDIKVDIVSTADTQWGPTNRWYAEGFERSVPYQVSPTLTIQILPLAYYLATKFEAFKGRGRGDYEGSHDIEDITTITDNSLDFESEIKKAPAHLYAYLKEEYGVIINYKGYKEAGLEYLGVEPGRVPLFASKLKRTFGFV